MGEWTKRKTCQYPDAFRSSIYKGRRKYGTEAEKILRIIINQYSDRTHFIYEILQNAEDAGATHIKFHLEKDKLMIFHNGRPFTEADIEGVCGIASGTKEDGTRIGHFGIGFKSVYCYTELPQIYSGKYHFEIRNQLFPAEIPEMQKLDYTETSLVELESNQEDGLDTKDTVFLLSYAETKEYMQTEQDWRSELTEYALMHHNCNGLRGCNAYWPTRTAGIKEGTGPISILYNGGGINDGRQSCSYVLRPAIWARI